jgi:proteasome accessory factor B
MTNLVLALLETTRPMSLREIGTAVAGYPAAPGPLRQAFERDKRTLRDGGIPITVERVDGEDQVGYRILPEQYYLPDLGLTEEESEALAFALAAVRLDGAVIGDLAQKLGAQASAVPPLAVLPALPALGALQEAIRGRAAASFAYRGRSRVVCGYALAFRQGCWYLVGNDETAAPGGALRTFRVDRIEGAVTGGEPGHYTIPQSFDAKAELRLLPFTDPAHDDAAVTAVLEVDVRAARAVVAMLGEGAVSRRDPDGSVEVRVAVFDEEAFVSFVLGLGDGAELISPEALRDRLVAQLQLAAAGPR